ncbi:hypothetical protein [Salinilacihabitans rarus]|uniref:hypothetical protein n=1 Tax=Salinilacihabitans rarus TaxID=2961596 RepID=UPI0020C8D460|nr:hypothetical protein [Salinilacihabitans rarus]
MALAALVEEVRAHPVAAALELGSLALAVVLPVATVLALAGGPPPATGETGPAWLLVLGGGAALALLWTVVVPLYGRLR